VSSDMDLVQRYGWERTTPQAERLPNPPRGTRQLAPGAVARHAHVIKALVDRKQSGAMVCSLSTATTGGHVPSDSQHQDQVGAPSASAPDSTSKMLAGKVALVTGAARGLGAAIARRLAAAGAHVHVTDVLEDEGEAVASSIGERASFHRLDVCDWDSWRLTVDALSAHDGRIDVLVNNAAVLHIGTIERTTPEDFRRLLEVNTTGPFLGIRAVSPVMSAAGGGSIINISSVDALSALNGLSAYAASKWGLRGLTKSAALELGRFGIRVNCVCPSGGNPDMVEPWRDRLAESAEDIARYQESRGIPGGGDLTQISDSVLFLASDLAQYVSGIDLPVDGGHTAGNFLRPFNAL
jgi:3alpha(or 20beta)-hydroxysteroid dehydrogenase